MKLQIFTDGGALGNPGPAAIGVIVKRKGITIKKIAKFLGQATNNVAEYMAVIEAFKWLIANRVRQGELLVFTLDSKLVVNQLNGIFKIKDQKLRQLVVQLRQLEEEAGGNVFYQQVPREKNQEADALVKSVLEQK